MSGEPQHPGAVLSLFDDAPFGYLLTDTDDVIVRVNATFLALTGFAASGVVGRRFRDLLPAGFQLLYETRHLPVLRLQGSVQEVFLDLVRADGSPVPVLVNAVVVGGQVRIGVLAAANRVSYERELLAAQRTAENLAVRVAVLQDASTAFAAAESAVAIADSLATILEETLVASEGSVALVDQAGGLQVVAGTNPLDGLIRDDRKLLGPDVVQFERTVVVHATEGDAAAYPWVVAALREARRQTVAVFPIMNDAEPVGVVAVYFRRQREITPSENELVLALARQAGQVLTRRDAQEQLAYAALHDQLTGLANRASIRRTITLAILAAHRTARPLSVMFLDLDGFKAVNDSLGHHVGDAILQQVSSRLRDAVRGGDLVGRYGGDEFVVVCHETSTDSAVQVAERVRERIRAGFAEAQGFALGASVGIAVYDGATAVTTDAIIGAADAAMYESKRTGRDRTTTVGL